MKQLSIKLLLLALSTLLLTNCKKTPTASFTMSKNAVGLGEKINFTNTSTHQKSCEWDFGDGTTATENDPQKSYDKASTYVVKLTSYARGEKKRDITFATVRVNSVSVKKTEELFFKGTYSERTLYYIGNNVFVKEKITTNVNFKLLLSNKSPNVFYFENWQGNLAGTDFSIPNQLDSSTITETYNGSTTVYNSPTKLTNGSGSLLNNKLVLKYTLNHDSINTVDKTDVEITYTGTKL